MSKIVEVRGVKIGEGIPKIIVPIVAKTKEEILAAAASFAGVRYDIVEWRVDWFDGVFDFAQVEDVLKDLRPALGDKPILFTFRTSKEGGEKAIEADAYAELNKKAAATGLVDMVDVEAFTGDEIVKDIIAGAHAAGVKVVASNHDFFIFGHECPTRHYWYKSISCLDYFSWILRRFYCRGDGNRSRGSSHHYHVHGRYRPDQPPLR